MRNLSFALALGAALGWAGPPAQAASAVQVGSSGQTFASSAVQCVADASGSLVRPMVKAGLYNAKRNASASVTLNQRLVATVTDTQPAADVWLGMGTNAVTVTLSRKTADTYVFNVNADTCAVPNTSGNTFSADGTLEYAASGKSYATVTPGCALNPASGQAQPYVHLFDNGGFLLNVSLNGVPLTQLSVQKTHTPVFLAAGRNVISAANGSLSTDYYLRDGGDGRCLLP
ncbi:hypothetical protein [Inhella proteolytica]|uniref:Uncharacterized protein n=1 Tax=Inhella proteolytica TaxID=2795029 RepID=A0A931J0P8_9BURK|nr:hypothetical protein [Inhella proteolytica]MBH9576578.1 hypothetical protein [Inhella proteolytica]